MTEQQLFLMAEGEVILMLLAGNDSGMWTSSMFSECWDRWMVGGDQ